jgi:hypothetical protein
MYQIHATSVISIKGDVNPGSLGLEVGTHVRQQNRVKGGCFLHARKLLKWGAFFKRNLEKGTFLEFFAQIT